MSETTRPGSVEEASYLASIIATQQEIATAHLNCDALMDLIAGRTQALTRADGAAVELAEGDEMVYRAGTGSAASHVGLRLKRDQSLSGLCVRTGQVLRCDDSEADERVDREACRQVGVRSMVVVPLTSGGRAVGVLKVLSPKPYAFGEHDVRTLQLLAGLLGASLDQAAQFEAKGVLLAERTAAFAELHREREFLKAVFEHAGDGIVACDAGGNLTVFNEAARLFHGLPAEPLPPEFWAERYDLRRPDGTPLPTEEVPLYRALRGESVRDAELVIAPKSVPPRTLLASGRAIRGPNGEKLGAVVVMQDVTERKRSEAERAGVAAEKAARAEAEAAERRYRSLAEAIPQVVWTAGADGSVEYFNGRWYDYTGLTPAESLGEGWSSVVHPEDRPDCLAHWALAVASGETYEAEYRFRRAADGAYRWHLGRGTPRRDPDGRVVEWFGTCTDIDDRKRAALELSAAKEAAEAANRAKDEFLAVLSHELRTPLTPVLAAASALLDDPSTPPQI
ncbi:MAG: PAS domain S-box protein, partial [Planctomycetia bacterium]|nr:PAS domain S-box protein [Planctomycetia bacterium]